MAKVKTKAEIRGTQELQAGTGFMQSLTEAIRHFEKDGYVESFAPHFNRLSCRTEQIHVYPDEIVVDQISRFENTSDPDDQSILYVLSVPSKQLKGLYVDSYGIQHDELSEELLNALMQSAA